MDITAAVARERFGAFTIEKLDLTEPHYGMPLQLWIQACKHGLTVKEIPVGLVYFQWRRGFSGRLSDPARRLAYYNRVIDEELFRRSSP